MTRPLKSANRKVLASSALSSWLRRSSGSALSSVMGVSRSGGASTVVSITSSRGGGGLTILLPDWAAAPAAIIRRSIEPRKAFLIEPSRESVTPLPERGPSYFLRFAASHFPRRPGRKFSGRILSQRRGTEKDLWECHR